MKKLQLFILITSMFLPILYSISISYANSTQKMIIPTPTYTPCSNDDIYEPDDDYLSATEVCVPYGMIELLCYFCSSIDEDWVTFSPRNDHYFNIYTTRLGADTDTAIEIFDPYMNRCAAFLLEGNIRRAIEQSN